MKLAIFSVEGTLIDSVSALALSWHQAFSEHGYHVTIGALRQHSGRHPDELIRALIPAARAQDLAKLKETQRACYRARYLDRVRPFPVARILLERLKRMNYTVALVSCGENAELRHYVHLARIAGFVDAMACADDAAETVAQLELIYRVLFRSKGVLPNDAELFGDTPFDAIAARRVGIRAVGLSCSGFNDHTLIAAGCVAVYRNLAALLDKHFRFQPSMAEPRKPILEKELPLEWSRYGRRATQESG